MANQLVLVGNRVVAHGQDCFSTIPGAVVCLTNGKIYGGATIAECSTECPADIDAVGYEYRAGEFVKCAPFYKGNGNVAVWCDECKAPLDSGFPSQFLGKVFTTTYTGTGTRELSITCGFKPKLAIVASEYYTVSISGTSRELSFTAIVSHNGGFYVGMNTQGGIGYGTIFATIGNDFIEWSASDSTNAMNVNGTKYTITVIG